MDELIKQMTDLHHDMATCQFNTYGVKPNTYYSWVSRMENLVKKGQGLQETQSAHTAKAPPPPPVQVPV